MENSRVPGLNATRERVGDKDKDAILDRRSLSQAGEVIFWILCSLTLNLTFKIGFLFINPRLFNLG